MHQNVGCLCAVPLMGIEDLLNVWVEWVETYQPISGSVQEPLNSLWGLFRAIELASRAQLQMAGSSSALVPFGYAFTTMEYCEKPVKLWFYRLVPPCWCFVLSADQFLELAKGILPLFLTCQRNWSHSRKHGYCTYSLLNSCSMGVRLPQCQAATAARNFYAEWTTTPLGFACFFGGERFVEFLLQHHADPQIQNARGHTPFELARGQSVLTLVWEPKASWRLSADCSESCRQHWPRVHIQWRAHFGPGTQSSGVCNAAEVSVFHTFSLHFQIYN